MDVQHIDTEHDNIGQDKQDMLVMPVIPVIPVIQTIQERWYCYILRNRSVKDASRTYNGKTNNPIRRLAEHNMIGSKTKGAAYTRKWGSSTWEFISIIGYFPSDVEALRHEWRIKKPEGKSRTQKYNGPAGRIRGLNYALMLERFTSKCETPIKDMDLNIWVLNEYADLLDAKHKMGLDKLRIIGSDVLDAAYITEHIHTVQDQ